MQNNFLLSAFWGMLALYSGEYFKLESMTLSDETNLKSEVTFLVSENFYSSFFDVLITL